MKPIITIFCDKRMKNHTPTFYAIFTEGDMPKRGDWWMSTYETFDGHIVAVNPTKYGKRTIDLPNGKQLSTANLAAYKDTNVVWKTRSANAAYGTPTIDGKMDDAYKKSTEISIDRLISNWGGRPTKTTGTARVLWDEKNIYVYAHVKDAVISYSYKIANLGEMYHRDSITFFIDVPHNGDGTETGYTPLQYSLDICANGDHATKNPTTNTVISDEFTIKSKVQRVSDGYIVEASCSWNDLIKDQIKAGKTIGFDVSIADDMGSGDNEAGVCWSDYTGNQFRYYSRLGNLTLKK